MALMQIFLGTLIFTPIFLAMLDKFLKAKPPSDNGRILSEAEKRILKEYGEMPNPYTLRKQYLMETTKASKKASKKAS